MANFLYTLRYLFPKSGQIRSQMNRITTKVADLTIFLLKIKDKQNSIVCCITFSFKINKRTVLNNPTQVQFFLRNTVVCISLETRIHYLAVVFIFVKIQKLLIYVLKDLKICHKFQHQNLQNSQGY